MRTSGSNFLRGVGSVIALKPSGEAQPIFHKHSRSDSEALASDWQRIGGDFCRAIEKVNQKIGPKRPGYR